MNKRAPTKPLPPLDYLHECLEYDTATGSMTWRERPVHHFKDNARFTKEQVCAMWNTQYCGKRAGSVVKRGYVTLTIDNELYLGHRVAFKMATGMEPSLSVDHVNGIRNDNRVCNLRLATHGEQMKNKTMSEANKSGVTGVYYLPKVSKRKPWLANGRANGVYTYLGHFPTLLEAAAVRKSWEVENGFSDRHGKALKVG